MVNYLEVVTKGLLSLFSLSQAILLGGARGGEGNGFLSKEPRKI